ncbi:ECF RNA polymerase sigma factor SigG [compost metagenome]|jgi:RNA polymerase sigma factor (sigma-70 family)|uniref:RNA polymerase sigma factor n=1 Tax=Paenibacillus rhizolycopersici TaxID=2780073 RepID=A0ABS2HB58_9BACL|nr:MULTISPECIES: RNA polymerase sigma factor [Paenibacillus]MBM6998088.1 RNA polymerase sigma factor [Paenibacillus rhizolycopersici]GIP50947.1 hypothetical protein J53TS2_45380 [Paenibacillus sp. J53TS2]
MPTLAKELVKRNPKRTRSNMEQVNFPIWIQMHGAALRNYCRSLAGSVWEGDDLAQDTWLKIWSATQGKGDDVQITRTYLYRTAQHAWIDRSRRKRLRAESLPMDELLQAPGQNDPAEVWGAMETLVSELSPLQRTALLLIDILQYTAGEAAQLIQSTEGAVKAALHRARVRLRNAVEGSRREGRDTSGKGTSIGEAASPDTSNDVLVYAYMDAVRREDAAALAMLYNDVRPQDIVPVLTLQSYRRNSLRSKSGSPATDPVQNRQSFMSLGLAA